MSLQPSVCLRFKDITVFFGHQSVGENVLDGIKALARDNGALQGIEIVEVESAAQVERPGIYHARIGKNRDPQSKLLAFEDILIGKGVGAKVDVACMKFCYVDISPETDVAKLFEAYASSMDRIQRHFPNLAIVHSTVPLTVHRGGLKKTLRNWIKGDLVNANRSQYNELLRERFGPGHLGFDVATAESTLPDGTRESFRWQGRTCYAAAPVYTEGAGHLNEAGGKHVAAEFVRVVSNTAAGGL